MPKYSDFKAVIFDVDDTLLDNHPDGLYVGLHGITRLKACHAVGKRHGSRGLQNLTEDDAFQAFHKSKVHSLQGAVWEMLRMAKEVSSENIDPSHPLLKEIMELKDEIHAEVLRTRGKPVAGAVEFVQAWAAHGYKGKMAIASTAYRRDVDLFLDMTGLHRFFPEKKVITREQTKQPKPDPEGYNLAFATLGLPEADRSKVIAFEDHPMGIMSAKAAGLYTCVIAHRHKKAHFAGLAVPPDLIAESFAEFHKLLDLPVILEP